MLVGRDVECRTLDGLLARNRLGHGGALLLVGEPGIGKTALLGHVAGHTEGMTLRRVVGVPAERGTPFGALALALEASEGDLARLPPPQAAALRVALALEEGPAPGRFVVGAATLGVLVAQAESAPLVLVLDDVHELDTPSAHALAFAARRLVADPVLMVAALRTDEPSPLRGAGLPELAVSGLDRATTADLLSGGSVGAAPDRIDRLHRMTGGNPLALLELSRTDPPREGPDGAPGMRAASVPAVLAASFLRRARDAGPNTVTLLALVEVAGGDLHVVLRAAPLLGVDGSAALAAAEAAGLVAVSGALVRAGHPLAASAAFASLAPDERRAVHRAVAGALPDREAGRRAWHLASAAVGCDEDVAATLADEGARAAARGAYAVAAAALERAAELTDDDLRRADRELDAAAAAFDAGDPAWTARLLDRMVVDALPGVLRTHHGELRGHLAALGGDLQRAWSVLVATARDCATHDPGRAVRLAAEAAQAAFYAMDVTRMREAAALVEELLARDLDDHARGLGDIALGATAVIDGRDGSVALRDGVELLARAPDGLVDDFAAVSLMIGLLFLRQEGHERQLREVVDRARASASVGALPYLLFLLARDEATTQQWSAAVADYAESAALGAELGQSTPAAMSLAGLSWIEARRGEEDACREHAAAALDLAAARQLPVVTVWVDCALAELDLVAGRLEDAGTRYTRLADRLEGSSFLDVDVSPDPELAEVLLRQERRAEAEAVAERHRRRAEAKGGPWSSARSLRTRGLLVANDAIDATFGAALQEHARTTDLFETARTRLAYGARLRRARRRVDARRELSAAYDEFMRIGARPWAELAATELAASGATVSRGDEAAVALTPREQQIVRLLAEGRTTREVAGALFVSPKTVEYHLRNVYARLGVSSRRELLDRIGEG